MLIFGTFLVRLPRSGTSCIYRDRIGIGIFGILGGSGRGVLIHPAIGEHVAGDRPASRILGLSGAVGGVLLP